MQNQLLLLEDVDNLGRSGDVVSTKPGYARNYLFPQKKAIVADKITLRLQKRLQEERAKRAVVDKAEALQIAERLAQITLTIQVKVDPEGKLYGSVSAADIMNLCAQEGIVLERKQLLLPHPIKALGNHTISLRLKEDIAASLQLSVNPDRILKNKQPEAVSEEPAHEPASE